MLVVGNVHCTIEDIDNKLSMMCSLHSSDAHLCSTFEQKVDFYWTKTGYFSETQPNQPMCNQFALTKKWKTSGDLI